MKPIGFWFIHLHQALESSLDRVLAADSLTRRHWQVLNSADSEALKPFGGVKETIADLRTRGWIDEDGLTEAGRAAHARLKAKVGEFRSRATEGISDDEYRATVGVLERMAANLARE
ncbi:MarR family winged helix-turn-helix transcriptional regulator [Amycolatopsis sp. NPDC102389]|uniref:MarR family winged helix-turn-helix transcriptional regulator n=1 Tax=Amycolatopsis sp. NPDC102389 TaxID=3363941 RepID=UPI00380C4140